MLDSLTDTPAFRRDPPAVSPESASVPAECPAPHEWQIECLEFRPTPTGSGVLLGFATLGLAGGLVLSGARLIRNPYEIGVLFNRTVAMKGSEPKRAHDGAWLVVNHVNFPRSADWHRFSRAAVAAVRRAYPDALPDDAPAGRQTAPDAAGADALPDFLRHAVTRPGAAPARALTT